MYSYTINGRIGACSRPSKKQKEQGRPWLLNQRTITLVWGKRRILGILIADHCDFRNWRQDIFDCRRDGDETALLASCRVFGRICCTSTYGGLIVVVGQSRRTEPDPKKLHGSCRFCLVFRIWRSYAVGRMAYDTRLSTR